MLDIDIRSAVDFQPGRGLRSAKLERGRAGLLAPIHWALCGDGDEAFRRDPLPGGRNRDPRRGGDPGTRRRTGAADPGATEGAAADPARARHR
jgi:hypothetical protein